MYLIGSPLSFSDCLIGSPIKSRFAAGRAVVELGCGGAGLCAVAGAHTCRRFTATDGSPQALDLLRQNLRSNAHSFIYERVGVQRLAWGDSAQIRAVQVRSPSAV